MPSLIIENCQSIDNKCDELHARTQLISEYRNSCAICYIETWLKPETPDSEIEPLGFKVFRGDRTPESGKTKGGGLCIFINTSWSTNSTIKQHICTPNLEVLVVSSRPFYLPREIPCTIFISVYLPNGYHRESVERVYDIVLVYEHQKPDAAIIILGDTNGVTFNLPWYKQYINCNTRNDTRLELCYCNYPNAYGKCYRRSPLGIADHGSIVLLPTYKQKLKQSKPILKDIKVWDSEVEDTIKGCLESTDWDIFFDSSETTDVSVDVISEYINFCVDSIVPTKTVKSYPNNTPWITKDIKGKINQKNNPKTSTDRTALTQCKKDLDNEIRISKNSCKSKLEGYFKINRTRDAWHGLNKITGYKTKSTTSLDTTDTNICDNLNAFYARFNREEHSHSAQELKDTLSSQDSENVTHIQTEEVRKSFKSLNANKACGPDNIQPRILKTCADQLSPIYT